MPVDAFLAISIIQKGFGEKGIHKIQMIIVVANTAFMNAGFSKKPPNNANKRYKGISGVRESFTNKESAKNRTEGKAFFFTKKYRER